MSTSYFSFSTDERVIWMAPKTRSIYAIYKGSEVKADGNEYAVIQPLPGIHDEKWSGESMTVLAEQLVPVYE